MSTKIHAIFTAALLLLLFASNLRANDIAVSNISLTSENTTDDYVMVQFDISWENSWHFSSGPANWDAAWVFVKYRVGSGEWQHASLNNTGHSSGTGTGATIDAGLLTPGSAFDAVTNPALGVFIHRSANGSGAFSLTGAQLRWNYGANSVADNATMDVQVFAIEMVYVPEGSFYIGSRGNEADAFYRYPTATNAFQVTSENAINVGTTADYLYYPANYSGGDQVGPIPVDFPKGFAGFYCQKYEITQQQYVDFLNTLTSTQASNRYSSGNTGTNRYGITVSGLVYSTANPYVACNFLSWMDGAAYSDWAGLRPMTELEYEKACRGTVTPVANEYAWGNTTATAANNITNPGASNETTTTSGANTTFGNQGNVQGPLRVGVFAKSGTTRAQAGASYYGIMELSGNLWEQTITMGNATGRAFTGVHGDGMLSTNGHATETAWPGLSSGEVTGANGVSFRGGSWDGVATVMRASDRYYGAHLFAGQNSFNGFRPVRQVP